MKPQATKLSDYQPPSILIKSIELEVDIQNKSTVVSSKIKGININNPPAGEGTPSK